MPGFMLDGVAFAFDVEWALPVCDVLPLHAFVRSPPPSSSRPYPPPPSARSLSLSLPFPPASGNMQLCPASQLFGLFCMSGGDKVVSPFPPPSLLRPLAPAGPQSLPAGSLRRVGGRRMRRCQHARRSTCRAKLGLPCALFGASYLCITGTAPTALRQAVADTGFSRASYSGLPCAGHGHLRRAQGYIKMVSVCRCFNSLARGMG